MSELFYLPWLPVNNKSLADVAVKLNIIGAERQLVKPGPVLRLKVLSIKIRAQILEGTFTEAVLLYGISAVVYRKMDDNRLKSVQNTTRRMMLRL